MKRNFCEPLIKLNNLQKLVYRVPFSHYHTYNQMCEELDYLAMEYCDIAQVYSLGRSVEGRQILGIKIAADVTSDRPLLRPQVKFSANLHGDEIVSREMIIALTRYILFKTNREGLKKLENFNTLQLQTHQPNPLIWKKIKSLCF